MFLDKIWYLWLRVGRMGWLQRHMEDELSAMWLEGSPNYLDGAPVCIVGRVPKNLVSTTYVHSLLH